MAHWFGSFAQKIIFKDSKDSPQSTKRWYITVKETT